MFPISFAFALVLSGGLEQTLGEVFFCYRKGRCLFCFALGAQGSLLAKTLMFFFQVRVALFFLMYIFHIPSFAVMFCCLSLPRFAFGTVVACRLLGGHRGLMFVVTSVVFESGWVLLGM